MFDLDFDATRGHTKLFSAPVVLHCNHYNAYLQRTVLDPDYIDCRDILADAAAMTYFSPLRQLAAAQAQPVASALLVQCAQLFSFSGFGLLDFSATSVQGGMVSSASSHYAQAWKKKFGIAKEPVAFFDAGFISAALSVAYGKPLGNYLVVQRTCISMGAQTNTFEVVLNRARALESSPAWSVDDCATPARSVHTTVDEDAIVRALASMPIVGNAEGLIPVFGVVLTRMAADYYNRISFEFERRLEVATGDNTLGALLLVEAGHSCAFNTFGGIMTSPEWKALIQPMCKTKEDWVHGIVAAVNTLGWGVWRVEELRASEHLRVRIYGGYESNGYQAMYGTSATPTSHLATAGVAGIMNLLWHVDVTQAPDLTDALYQSEFSRPGAFLARQTACRTMGSSYDEFVAERG
jgi:hypothetical protein